MRPMPDDALERLRDVAWELQAMGATAAGTGTGCFRLWSDKATLRIVSSHDMGVGWEHVSVSCAKRCPTWEEMCRIKDLFWLPEETVMQLHPPKDQHVNNHPFCLHLWRPTQLVIPMPPAIMVGVKDEGVLRDKAHAQQVRDKLRGAHEQ